MKKQIIRLTESDLHNIIENTVNRVLKEYENNDYGIISNNNVGKQGMKKAKMFNEIKLKLINNENVSYNLPIDFDKVFSINISPLGNNVFSIETNYGNKKQVGVDNVLKVINDMYTDIMNNKSL